MQDIIYLKIMGNAGNQFFQYAFARQLQEINGGRLVIDYSDVHYDKSSWEGSDNLLSNFNTVQYEYVISNKKCPHKLLFKLIKLSGKILRIKPYTSGMYNFYLFCAKNLEKFGMYYFGSPYFQFSFPRLKKISVNGYFESPKYFARIDDKIKEELTPRHELLDKNKDLYKKICDNQSVCISIKRMDVDNPYFADVYQYDIRYFYHAVKYIEAKISNPVWIIFSDNIEWCKENFHLNGEVYYETENNPIWEKIRLMSSCKHFIIHNSTFSWWAQHLSGNKNKIVICPTKWMNRDDQPIDIYEDYFIYMDNDGNVLPLHL